jgi:alpha-L-fucosidase
MPCTKERLKWFNEQRFGMFIHWGLYSLTSKGEWYRYNEDVPADKYHALAGEFKPCFFRPDEWARLARDAGMRYMVLTAKHHDGYCLFDSQYTDFTSVKTAAKRDFIREYADACRAEGLGGDIFFLQGLGFPRIFPRPRS